MTPLVVGAAVAVAALAGRYGIEAWQAYKAAPSVPRMRRYYEGGFQPVMTRREAALILGVRYVLDLSHFSAYSFSNCENSAHLSLQEL